MLKKPPDAFARQLLTTVALVALLLGGCDQAAPLRVGFVGVLSGRSGDIGTAGRDGALLAVEEANAGGGIDGREVLMLVQDDRQDPASCRRAVTGLIDQGVAAIVGPMTSAMAMVAVPIINARQIPMVSPTASTVELAGQDDYFFRVIPVSTRAAHETAEHIATVKGCRSILAVYDEENRAYTEPWFEALRAHLSRFPAATVKGIGYSSKNGYDFLAMAEKIRRMPNDCLVILANGLDTALLNQQLAKLGMDLPVVVSEWSLTEELFEYGGRTIDGLELFHSFDHNSTSPSFLTFVQKFQDRFGYSPNFASAYGYNAMKIILAALERGSAPGDLRREILAGSPYEGVQQEVFLDEFGDAIRPYVLLRIQQGRTVTVRDDAQN